MPAPQQAIILKGLHSFQANRAAGQEGWVSFKSLGEEHWLQYAPDSLNLDWPFGTPPDETFIANYLLPLGEVKCVGWELDTYATFETGCHDWELLSGVIDDVFCRLYELGPDYRLDCSVEES